jgi:ribosomal protein S18 acetylase RimI-like enzyme
VVGVGWLIEEPTAGDAEELGRVHVEIWRQAYAGLMPPDYLTGLDPVAFADTWRVRLADAPSQELRLVARDDLGIAAFSIAGPPRIDDPPADWELYAINLLSRAQGTGLADELLDRSLGDRAAYLWVIEGNERAQAFYRKHGFDDDGGRTIDEPSGAPEIRMVRPTVGDFETAGTSRRFAPVRAGLLNLLACLVRPRKLGRPSARTPRQ